MTYSPDAVQLTGEDLTRARALLEDAQRAVAAAQAAFTELGDLVKTTLGDDRDALTAVVSPPDELQSDDGSSVVVTYYAPDGHCLYVMEDPPGHCRPCTDSKPGPTSPAPPAAVLLSR